MSQTTNVRSPPGQGDRVGAALAPGSAGDECDLTVEYPIRRSRWRALVPLSRSDVSTTAPLSTLGVDSD